MELVIERPGAGLICHPLEGNLVEVIRRLAPVVPADAVWYCRPNSRPR